MRFARFGARGLLCSAEARFPWSYRSEWGWMGVYEELAFPKRSGVYIRFPTRDASQHIPVRAVQQGWHDCVRFGRTRWSAIAPVSHSLGASCPF
eukprot:scaffold950_cov360-Pavlova_lutheri.AAC.41